MIRATGTFLLAAGFLMLFGAWAIVDPFANDANIGAGGMLLLGRPAGVIGLLLLLIDAILRIFHKRARDNPPVARPRI